MNTISESQSAGLAKARERLKPLYEARMAEYAKMAKPCPVCGKEIRRIDFTCTYHYNNAITCGVACAKEKRRRESEAANAPRTCKQCGKPFKKRHGEILCLYHERQYCNVVCAGGGKSPKGWREEKKPCASCKSEMAPRERDTYSIWRARKTCSAECISELRRNIILQRKQKRTAVVASPQVVVKPLALSATMCAYCKKLPVMQGRRYCSPECADSLMRLEEARERLYRPYQPSSGHAAVTCVKCARVATNGKYCSRHGEG